jgi:hypothetical protein
MRIVQYQTNIHPIERMHNAQIWSVYVQFAGGFLGGVWVKATSAKAWSVSGFKRQALKLH